MAVGFASPVGPEMLTKTGSFGDGGNELRLSCAKGLSNSFNLGWASTSFAFVVYLLPRFSISSKLSKLATEEVVERLRS